MNIKKRWQKWRYLSWSTVSRLAKSNSWLRDISLLGKNPPFWTYIGVAMVNAPNPCTSPPTPMEDGLLSSQPFRRGRGGGKGSPPEATIDPIEGDVPGEGDPVSEGGGAPLGAAKEASDPPTDILTGIPVDALKGLIEAEDPVCGEKK
ncbi:UNVERIFIED_CONTAM: hypothetical protein Sradi_0001300 [Sesamum radiatum]|uniref:Uncharacterized protein n=1 Tax=Sesamum radiatum TaxID=300843 RepID=A0AAW2WHR5_SESRA